MFFAFLFALGNRHAKARCKKYDSLCLTAAGIAAVFAVAMVLIREMMTVNIFVSVVFVFVVFGLIYRYGRLSEMPGRSE